MQRQIGLYFASRHGQTRAITIFLANRLVEIGARVTVIDLTPRRPPADSPPLDHFDTVLIGAPLYLRRYPASVRRFVRTHRDALARHPSTGVFSVSLTAAGDQPGDDVESIGPLRQMLADLSWTPTWIATFAGALAYTRYNPLVRRIMRRIARQHGAPTDTAHDHELTRWADVATFAQHVATNQPVSRYRGSARSLPARTLDRLMPIYEHRIITHRTMRGSPADIRRAIDHLHPSDTVPLTRTESNEVAFAAFHEPGHTKAVTDVWFDDVRDRGTIVRAEIRLHTLDPTPRRRTWYWRIMGPVILLRMRRTLRGIALGLRSSRQGTADAICAPARQARL